jgi:hypothetical protein
MLEHRDVTPRILQHLDVERHTTRFQQLEYLPAICGLDGVRRWNALLKGNATRVSRPSQSHTHMA